MFKYDTSYETSIWLFFYFCKYEFKLFISININTFFSALAINNYNCSDCYPLKSDRAQATQSAHADQIHKLNRFM